MHALYNETSQLRAHAKKTPFRRMRTRRLPNLFGHRRQMPWAVMPSTASSGEPNTPVQSKQLISVALVILKNEALCFTSRIRLQYCRNSKQQMTSRAPEHSLLSKEPLSCGSRRASFICFGLECSSAPALPLMSFEFRARVEGSVLRRWRRGEFCPLVKKKNTSKRWYLFVK
jgi:hypothetical protein